MGNQDFKKSLAAVVFLVLWLTGCGSSNSPADSAPLASAATSSTDVTVRHILQRSLDADISSLSVGARDIDGALAALRDFVDRHPRDARGWITLGRLLDKERDDPDGAFSALREGLEWLDSRCRRSSVICTRSCASVNRATPCTAPCLF